GMVDRGLAERAAAARRAPATRLGSTINQQLSTVRRHAVLLFFVAAVLVPLLWSAFSSVKSVPEQYRVPQTILPHEPTLEGYGFVLANVPLLPVYYANSLVVAGVATFGTAAMACLAGYSFGRLDFWG